MDYIDLLDNTALSSSLTNMLSRFSSC